MEVKLGISNRHVHLTKEDYGILFGNNNILKERDLIQPGQYASKSFVTIKTSKSSFDKVRVLGPFRDYTQVEISKSDSYKLGINPPIRDSGNLEDSCEIEIIGPNGSIKRKACIIATRHIHITKEMLQKYGLENCTSVSVEFNSLKSTIFKNVKLKVMDDAVLELHLDTDDANGAFLKQGDMGIIIMKQKNY